MLLAHRLFDQCLQSHQVVPGGSKAVHELAVLFRECCQVRGVSRYVGDPLNPQQPDSFGTSGRHVHAGDTFPGLTAARGDLDLLGTEALPDTVQALFDPGKTAFGGGQFRLGGAQGCSGFGGNALYGADIAPGDIGEGGHGKGAEHDHERDQDGPAGRSVTNSTLPSRSASVGNIHLTPDDMRGAAMCSTPGNKEYPGAPLTSPPGAFATLLMTNLRRIAIIAALVPAGLVLLVGIVYGVDRSTNGGEILGRVSVAGVDLGGLGREDAAALMAEIEADLASAPIEVTVAGHKFSLLPSDVGYDLDTDAILAEAFAIGRDREGEWPGQFSWWISHFGNDAEPLELLSTYDADAVAALISEWELEGIDAPPYAGNVEMAGYFVQWEHPSDGTGIDRITAASIIGEALEDPSRPAVELPTRALPPQLTAADIDAAVAKADRLLSGPVRLINQTFGTEIEIPRHVLADSLIIRMDTTTGPPTFDFTWTGDALRGYVEPRLKAHRTEATDARIVINDDDTVSIIPSARSRAPDLEVLVGEVSAAAASITRTGALAYDEGVEAEFSTADAEALGIREKISEFTTFHPCCAARVTNIQLIADAVDGAMVLPGETWSLNDHVGQRTLAKGYVRAGAIISGYVQCCDSDINIGGGTSQFTTTMYNAIFYAGLEDIYHMPHTMYFTRYPEGIEATLGYLSPDLVFRNNTENVVLIKTEHTDTSVTVKMFGDNGGIQVEAERSDRFNYTGPITRYEISDELCETSKEDGRVKESGSGGWSIRVYRHITYPDGEVTTDEWVWHYDGGFKVIEYNPAPCP